MGRNFETIENLITKTIERGGSKHQDKSLIRDSAKIFCTKCSKHVTFKRANISTRVDEHLKSVKHNENKKKSSSTLITVQMAKVQKQNSSDEQFKLDLLDTFLSCDIALHKLKMDKMKDFLKKYCSDQKIPHPDTLRERIEPISIAKIAKIREIVGDSDVYFQVDETPDCKSRSVVNVIVGKLNDNVSKPMLLYVDFQKLTNWETIRDTVLDACQVLWPNENRYRKLVLLLSDQASYMVRAGKELKKLGPIFPNISHVTCLNHAISLVCNSIMKEFYLVNKLFTYEQKYFKNANKRKRDWKRKTKLKLIPSPIQTRWGSWIKCANYHRENLDAIRSYFARFEEDNQGTNLYKLKKVLSGQKIDNDILRLTDKYSDIPRIITTLEGDNLKMEKQLELLSEIEKMISGTSHEHILKGSLRKNPDFFSFTSKDNTFSDRVKRTYAPLTSCAVERSFSVFRCLFRENRSNITKQNLRDMMIVKYNSFLD